MINRAILVGRLTRDPELRYTANGAAVANFTVAVNRTFKNAQGEREADFINCIIWRKAAENFANFTKKGSLVGIEGRIQTSSYENQQGQKVYRTDVNVDNFSLLESKNERNSNNDQKKSINSSNGYSNSNDNQTNGDPFADGKQVDISDSDLPF
ncbi:single-stranded DNA-binding protein [Companilactobacillus alimentarius]|uniref:single-stranded DNA-binding protein n=1 Tax=Companilactobacillus alimentarius TaxID=1602 RepID=UPI0028B7A38B|nr:single-stranded DNA-binding protein [Companilactobacillus alimentarius]MDT6953192.1 single-stranded DNA-binding protein [Companilactobacillus alimentarius]